MSGASACVFCEQAGGDVLWRGERCRVVLANEPGYSAFCRVIWNAHVREMTDLPAHDRQHYMEVVFAAEAALRALTQAHKINLASLGNQVPHLHWHVVARFADDRNYPNPVWGKLEREGGGRVFPQLERQLALELESRLGGG